MKLSKDLYNSGLLRRERLGPSEDWGFDSRLSLREVWGCVFGLLRRVGGHRQAAVTQRQYRDGAGDALASFSNRRGGNPWQPR